MRIRLHNRNCSWPHHRDLAILLIKIFQKLGSLVMGRLFEVVSELVIKL